MNMLRLWLFVALSLCAAGASASSDKHYHFKVFLDDKEIGDHRFVVSPRDDLTYVTSEARFDVKFLFINAYRYRHDTKEVWHEDCLRTIDATTDDNGERLFVRGEYGPEHFSLVTRSGEQQLGGCVRSFAYWDPRLIASPELLNAQTGELMPVDIKALEEATIRVRGEPVQARRYRIQNDEFNIDVWYSQDQEWLALESTTDNGSRLRYRIQ